MVLTKAAGVNLKDILTIDYSWGEIQFEYSPMHDGVFRNALMSSDGEELGIDIEPDDIEVSDTVTVVWEIE